MHILIFINVCLCACIHCDFKSNINNIFSKYDSIAENNTLYKYFYKTENINTKTNLLREEEYNGKRMMDLLYFIMPIKFLYNHNLQNNTMADFNLNLVEPLRKYLLMTYKYIKNIEIIYHKNEDNTSAVENIIELIVLDDDKIGILLQYYYYQSQDISKIFKICWFYIEIKQIWNAYKTRNNNTSVKTFREMFENKIYSTIDINMNSYNDEDPKMYLSKTKNYFYALSDSKINVKQDTSYNWFTIKYLSMKPVMELMYFSDICMNKVTYNKNIIYFMQAYDEIISKMDIYTLFKFNHFSKIAVLRQFDKFLVNILLTYSKLYELIHLKLKYWKLFEKLIILFTRVSGIIIKNIERFEEFFEKYFNCKIETLCSYNINQIYAFIKSNNHTTKKYQEYKELDEHNYTKLLSLLYMNLAFKASVDLDNVHYVLDEENEHNYENNMNEKFEDEETRADEEYKINKSKIFSISKFQVDTISNDNFNFYNFKRLINNLIHMNLMISVYTCLIAKRLDIKRRYVIYNLYNEELKIEIENYIDYDRK